MEPVPDHGEIRVAWQQHVAERCSGLHVDVHAEIRHAVSRVNGQPVSVIVEAVRFREGHLERRDRRPGLFRRDRHRDPVDVSRRIVLDERRILALRDRFEERVQGIGAVLRRGTVRDVSNLQAEVRDQLVAFLERERNLPLLRLVARVVELLDDHDPREALCELNLYLGPVHLGRERRRRLDDHAERGRGARRGQQRDHDEADREHEPRGLHARTSEAAPASTNERWSVQTIKRTTNNTGQKTRKSTSKPV